MLNWSQLNELAWLVGEGGQTLKGFPAVCVKECHMSFVSSATSDVMSLVLPANLCDLLIVGLFCTVVICSGSVDNGVINLHLKSPLRDQFLAFFLSLLYLTHT